ncbi:hypothetical protein AB0M87_14465 [Streptomyces sp. NPDC051320]|uniref:hypothetical protein n=1 Tax=Streptomyces sp. NPDC051320 TaxID=3154644 RepID=UPI0034354CAF
MDKLTVVLGDYPHAQPLLDGDTEIGGYLVEPVEVKPVIGAYRRKIRDLEFDVCELAPVSYLMARQEGIALTAVPVFLNRRFHHGDVQCAANSGIRTPAALSHTGDVDQLLSVARNRPARNSHRRPFLGERNRMCNAERPFRRRPEHGRLPMALRYLLAEA